MQYSYTSKLADYTQITTAEMVAINHALQMILEKNINEAIIFSDTKAAIQKIASTNPINMSDLLTKRGILEVDHSGINIMLAWILEHDGINKDEKADTLSNIGRN